VTRKPWVLREKNGAKSVEKMRFSIVLIEHGGKMSGKPVRFSMNWERNWGFFELSGTNWNLIGNGWDSMLILLAKNTRE